MKKRSLELLEEFAKEYSELRDQEEQKEETSEDIEDNTEEEEISEEEKELDEMMDSGEYLETTAEYINDNGESFTVPVLVTNEVNYLIEDSYEMDEFDLADNGYFTAYLLEDIDDMYTRGTAVSIDVRGSKLPLILVDQY